jgi:3'-phosphoadenosine 5'-phosphosulfate (PAPS) 3'-phosphatase
VAANLLLVDALDSTREFINEDIDYAVDIGVVERRTSTLGVAHAPARSTVWGDLETSKAPRSTQPLRGACGPALRIAVRQPTACLRPLARKSASIPETEAGLPAAAIDHRVLIGPSLKFALLAACKAGVYLRCVPPIECAAGARDADLRAASGGVFELDGQPRVHGKPGGSNAGFLATGLCEAHALRPFMHSVQPMVHFQ